MKIKNSTGKATFKVFILSAIYYGCCFFIFIFLINNVIIELFSSGEIDLSRKSLSYLFIVSLIIGIASGARIWFFTKIDERKVKKTSSTDSE